MGPCLCRALVAWLCGKPWRSTCKSNKKNLPLTPLHGVVLNQPFPKKCRCFPKGRPSRFGPFGANKDRGTKQKSSQQCRDGAPTLGIKMICGFPSFSQLLLGTSHICFGRTTILMMMMMMMMMTVAMTSWGCHWDLPAWPAPHDAGRSLA